MNVPQITHIFWKEYRTQRSIWLGVLVLIVSIQLMIGFSLRDGQGSAFSFLFGFGSILSMFYALASVGVMFAGEHEERTFDWLRTLPVARVPLFTGKLLWLVVSWLVAVLVIAIFAWLPDIGIQGTAKSNQLSSDRDSMIVDYFILVSGMLLWGFFFSLTFKKVYAALIWSAVAFLLSMGVYPNLFGSPNGLRVSLYLAMSGVLILATVIQGRRWLYPRPLLENLSFQFPTRMWTLDRALAAPADASPISRVIRRQVWLEWQNARWVLLALAVAPLAFLSLMGSREAFTLNCVLLLGIAPLVCGIGTVRAEQNQERYRFQANAGVSPTLLWCVKHLVWGSFYLGLLAAYAGILYLWATTSYRGEQTLSSLLERTPEFPYKNRMLESLGPVVWLTLAYTSFVYTLSHVASLLIKRSLTAGVVAVIAAWGGAVLTWYFLLLDMSLLVTLVFPSVLLMAFAYARTSGWLTDCNESRDHRGLIGMLCLMGMVCLTSIVVWRLSEIFVDAPFSLLNSTIYSLAPISIYFAVSSAFDPLWCGGVALVILALYGTVFRYCKTWSGVLIGWGVIHILVGAGVAGVIAVLCHAQYISHESEAQSWPKPSAAAIQTGEMYRSLDGAMRLSPVDYGPGASYQGWKMFTGQHTVSQKHWEFLDLNQDTLKELMEITAREDCSPPDPSDAFDRGDVGRLIFDPHSPHTMLRLDAFRAESEGRLADAWTRHLAHMRMFRHLLQWQMPNERTGNLRYFTSDEGFHTDLHRWVDHPGQTPELLQQAAEDLNTLFNELPSLSEAYTLRTRAQLEFLSEAKIRIDEQLLLALHRLPWERQRALMLTVETNNHLIFAVDRIDQGYDEQYGAIIAGSMNGIQSPPYDVIPVWQQDLSRSEVRRVQDRWRVVHTTPLFMASYRAPIRGYGVAPMTAAGDLIEEVNLIRQRRLLSLHLAIRISELSPEAPLRDSWLEQMQDARESEVGTHILDEAEAREGNHPSQQDETYTRLRRYLLYYDPVTGELFAQSTINHWGN